MKLTQRRIEGLICPAGKKDKLAFDDDQKGLAVRVTASGGKTYLAHYSHAGKKRRVPLGTVDAISLAQARIAARAIMGDVAKGRDPATERKEKALAAKRKKAHDALTVGKLVGDWEALHLVNKRPRYAFEATRAIRSVFKDYLDWPAAGLTRDRIVDTLDQLTREGSPIMASRAGVYLGSAYQWAIDRGKLHINPCARLPRAAPTERDRVLTDPELRAVWAATESAGAFNAIVRMLILTGQRREEVAAMTWGELSADFSTWKIPGSRTKNGLTHIVPLSWQAQATLEGQPRLNDNPHVFPGPAAGAFKSFSSAKTALDRACGVEGWVLHDLRRTVATNLQKLGARLEVTEACLNHVSGSRAGIVGVYQRHHWADEKRAALTAWGARVGAMVDGGEAGGNVVVFAREGSG
jgi:integrase